MKDVDRRRDEDDHEDDRNGDDRKGSSVKTMLKSRKADQTVQMTCLPSQHTTNLIPLSRLSTADEQVLNFGPY